MGQILSFTAIKNDRRAAEAIEQRQAARAEREAKEIAAVVELVSHNPLLVALVASVVKVDKEARRREDASRPMPAYCDPSNEVRGAKYDATKSLSTVEIAKRIRSDVKAAIAAGRLPQGLKVSVRSDSFSGGTSIDLRITALPASFAIMSPRYVKWCHENVQEARYGRSPFRHEEIYTSEFAQLLKSLKAIHSAYNRNNSDAMSDYFDVAYYGDAGIDWQLERDLRKSEGMPD